MPLMANIAKRAAASAPTTSRTLPGLLALNRLEEGLSSSSSKSSPNKSPRASSPSPQFLCRRIGHILLFLPVSRHHGSIRRISSRPFAFAWPTCPACPSPRNLSDDQRLSGSDTSELREHHHGPLPYV